MKKNILIIILTILSLCLVYYSYKTSHELSIERSLIESGYYSNGTYTDVNLDKEINSLKKENKELYDSIKQYKNEINFLTQYSYKKEYKLDTVYVKEPNMNDSIQEFKYSNNHNDSINYNLIIGSKIEPNWYKIDINISDKFTIINRNQDDINRTTITSDNGGEITDVTVFNKNKHTFKDNFSHGIVGGVGYGVLNHNVDVFVGYGITIKF